METPKALQVFLVLCVLAQCQSYKILTVSIMASRSHYILISRLSKILADEGHDVTLISPYNNTYTPKKGSYREIQLTGFIEEANNINMFKMGSISPFLLVPIFSYMSMKQATSTLNHTNVQNLIRSKEKFDVVIIEQLATEALKGLAPHFGAHLVLFSPTGQNYWINAQSGTPTLPSYDPEFWFGFTSKMTFFQRVQNTLLKIIIALITNIYLNPGHNQLAQEYISPDINLHDVIYNSSLVLVNTHVSVSNALPKVPNMVFIGGFHLDDTKPLPKDLKQLLDSSKNGVVLFSMGSVLESTDFPVDKRDALLRVFGKLKQTVLWKYEDVTLTKIPNNVKIYKWLPQYDLLAHPNLKLFITHSGYGSTTETIYQGKPVVAMPVFGDQFLNAATLESLGVGRSLAFSEFSEKTFGELVSEVLDNPRYSINAKEVSEKYKDRTAKPTDEVLYWIDYIVKYNGAPHLQVVSLQLPWYQLYLIDVFAFFLSVVVLSVVVFKKVFGWFRSNRDNSEKAKKKKD